MKPTHVNIEKPKPPASQGTLFADFYCLVLGILHSRNIETTCLNNLKNIN